MKVCLLGPTAYAGRVDRAAWPVPPDSCDRETAAMSYKIQLDQFQLADELGFDWVSVSEHHYAPGLMTPNPIVMAAAASQRTKSVRIAVLGPLMPLTNPVRVAEEIAMLDSISGGRAVVLPLRGTPNEHLTYTVDGKASPVTREVTQEATKLMIKAWQEPAPFSWRGEHFSFEHVSVWPRVLQQPHPPVFFSGNSAESIAFAAANRLNLAIGFAPAPQVAKHVAAHERERALPRPRARCPGRRTGQRDRPEGTRGDGSAHGSRPRRELRPFSPRGSTSHTGRGRRRTGGRRLPVLRHPEDHP